MIKLEIDNQMFSIPKITNTWIVSPRLESMITQAYLDHVRKQWHMASEEIRVIADRYVSDHEPYFFDKNGDMHVLNITYEKEGE